MATRSVVVQPVFKGMDREVLTWGEHFAKRLGSPLLSIEVVKHPDRELYFLLPQKLPERAIVIASIYRGKPNLSLIAFIQVVHTLKWYGVREVVGVLPYYPYSRQDRVDKPGAPLTSKWVAKVIEASGVDKLVLVDPHEEQLAGYFNIPTLFVPTHALWRDALTTYLGEGEYEIVSPDMGMVKRLTPLLHTLGQTSDLLVVFKRRDDSTQVTSFGLNRHPRFKKAIIVDDIIASGGTLKKAADFLRKEGIKEIYAAVTHPVLTRGARENLGASAFRQILLGNTIYPLNKQVLSPNITVVDLSALVVDYVIDWGFI